MSDPHNQIPQGGAGLIPGRRTSVATVLMVIIGILLLLPGLCALYFVVGFAITEPQNLFKFNDPIQTAIWMLWGVCFVVAIGGVLLLWGARRRARPR